MNVYAVDFDRCSIREVESNYLNRNKKHVFYNSRDAKEALLAELKRGIDAAQIELDYAKQRLKVFQLNYEYQAEELS